MPFELDVIVRKDSTNQHFKQHTYVLVMLLHTLNFSHKHGKYYLHRSLHICLRGNKFTFEKDG